jgi:tRNA-Thr(GGU) m(6)t(6)A37 methyltransferase TsaA
MTIEPIAFFHSPMTSKFGIPRQSGLADALPGQIIFEPPFRHPDAVRGLDDFDYLWLIWEFSANASPAKKSLDANQIHNDGMVDGRPSLTVRPPRLGGNTRIGVFASRSPFRPNRLGLSCVYINKVELTTSKGPVIHVRGADLMDGTPIYDIKPYVAYADSHPDARSGFVDTTQWQMLDVVIPDTLAMHFTPEELTGLRQVLAQDPRPPYHDDDNRVYGMPFVGRDVRFRVADGVLSVVEVV